jgi:hypothetical protein
MTTEFMYRNIKEYCISDKTLTLGEKIGEIPW